MANFGPRLDIQRIDERIQGGYMWWASSTPRRNAAGVVLNRRSYKCAERGCNATARQAVDGVWELPDAGAHSHNPNPDLHEIARMLRELYIKRSHSYASSTSMYDAVRLLFARNVVHQVPFDRRLVDRMAVWRRAIAPPVQNTFVDMQNLMQLPEWAGLADHDRGRVYIISLTARDNNTALAWGDQSIIQSLGEGTEYSLTIAISPRILPRLDNTSQVLTASVVYDGYVLPFAYVCFNDVTYEIVLEAIQFLRRDIMQQAHQQPMRIVTNCDWRLRDAIEQVWPGVEISSSWHSVCLAIMHRASIEQVDLNNNDQKLVLKKLMTLAWLPQAVIRATFEQLADAVQRSQYGRIFIGLMEWFARNFIRGFLPNLWSCFGKDHLLSTWPERIPQLLINEAFPGRLVPTPTIQFFKFYESSLNIIADTHKKIGTLLNQENAILQNTPRELTSLIVSGAGRPTFTSVHQLRDWLNVPGRLEPSQYLSISANLMDHCYNQILRTRENVNCFTTPWEPDRPVRELNGNHHINGDNNRLVLLQVMDIEEFQEIQARRARARGGRRLRDEDLVEDDDDDENPEINVAADDDVLHAYRWKCIRCDRGIIRMICKPCNCVCLCQACANDIRTGGQQLECPMCDERVTTFEIVYLPETNNPALPIDWTCSICEVRAVSRITTACRHAVCNPCFVLLRARFDGVRIECPTCRAATGVIEARFPPWAE